MGRRCELFIGAAIASLLGLSGGAGCVGQSGDATIIILQNQAPESGCSASPSSAEYQARGFIDARASLGYIFTPVVQNFTATTDEVAGSLRIAFIEGAEIRIEPPSGLLGDSQLADLRQRNLLEFSQPFSATIEPGARATMSFEVIPKAFLEALQGPLPDDGSLFSLKVAVQLFGRLGGGEITSQQFVYWVDICDGCATVDLGDCALIDPGADIGTGGTCNLLQDGYLECCTDAGALVCPAKPSSST